MQPIGFIRSPFGHYETKKQRGSSMEQQNERPDTPVAEEESSRHSSVFRQKSIDRISSPEQLNDYIRVASPRMWVVLAAVVLFLAGAVIWAVFGHIESTVQGVAIVDGGKCTVYVAQASAALLKKGDPAVIGDEDATLTVDASEPFTLPEAFPAYAASVGGFAEGEWICSAEVTPVALDDGIYAASVVEESISPISFLTDKN